MTCVPAAKMLSIWWIPISVQMCTQKPENTPNRTKAIRDANTRPRKQTPEKKIGREKKKKKGLGKKKMPRAHEKRVQKNTQTRRDEKTEEKEKAEETKETSTRGKPTAKRANRRTHRHPGSRAQGHQTRGIRPTRTQPHVGPDAGDRGAPGRQAYMNLPGLHGFARPYQNSPGLHKFARPT